MFDKLLNYLINSAIDFYYYLKENNRFITTEKSYTLFYYTITLRISKKIGQYLLLQTFLSLGIV